VNPKLRTVAARIHTELKAVERVVSRVLEIWEKAGTSGDDYLVDAAALNLHAFYAGIERICEVIADGVDQTRPSGVNWHQELLRQMATEIPGVRPAVFNEGTVNLLDRYRGFRHVVRNVYTFNLDAAQVEILVRQLRETFDKSSRELLALSDFLEELSS